MNGVLIIDKPSGMTSHDVVNRVRRILDQKSVGHLGTLDPMATGVLALVVGNLTRIAQFYTSAEKVYEGLIRFGVATDTYDADGEPVGQAQEVHLLPEQLEELASKFRGTLKQMPPPFSAKKIKGVPAYKLARKQKEVPLKPVEVEVKEFELLETQQGTLRFRAHVSSGTYVRSIAHDMGQWLGCGAHLSSLRRTAVAEFTLADAITLDALATAIEIRRTENVFVHPRKLLPQFPSVTANEEQLGFIRSGRAVNLSEMSRARLVKVFEGQRDLIAIATRVAGTLFHPGIVFANSPEPVARTH
jgi:tRNA pseudouridine55 synthase